MKAFFINPPFKAQYGRFARENRSAAITRSGTLYYPLWLIYAAAVCEADGFEIEFQDAPAEQGAPMDYEDSLNDIANRGADACLFVIDTSTPSIESDIAFADALKHLFPDAFVMLVGTHPSALPRETLENAELVDAVAMREYDYIVRDVARAIREKKDPRVIPGLAWCDDKRHVTINDPYPFITDLDEIPYASAFMKAHGIDPRSYFFSAAAYPEIQIFTGRGCPARCTFCVYPQTMHGHRYRLRSPENVVGEFTYIVDNFPEVREVVIEDDTFTANKKRVIEICNLLIEQGLNKKLRWLCNARVNLDFETMCKMREAGCHLIIPGIESASQEILNNIRKGTTEEMVERYAANAKRAGLAVHACYMVGNRGETPETMRQTFDLAMRLDTDTAQFYPLLPFPGTEAYDWAKENGYINGGYSDYVQEDGTINSLIELPGLSSREMVSFCDEARRKYYLRPSYIIRRLRMGLSDPDDLRRSLKAFGKIKQFLIKK